jgi:hypothetical protein
MQTDKTVEIRSRDYWFKIVEFLQQNWALIDEDSGGTDCAVFFIGDTSGVFDRLRFASVTEAEEALLRNGFRRYDTDAKAKELIGMPEPPFWESKHPNGSIYSSGRYWKKSSGQTPLRSYSIPRHSGVMPRCGPAATSLWRRSPHAAYPWISPFGPAYRSSEIVPAISVASRRTDLEVDDVGNVKHGRGCTLMWGFCPPSLIRSRQDCDAHARPNRERS